MRLTDDLTEVKARRVRTRRGGVVRPTRDPELEGVMTALPRIGQPMLVYTRELDRSTTVLLTTAVSRILVDDTGLVAFVATANSVYRLAFERPFIAEPKQPARQVRLAADGSELTFIAGRADEGRTSLTAKAGQNKKSARSKQFRDNLRE